MNVKTELAPCRKACKGTKVGDWMHGIHHDTHFELLTEPVRNRIRYILTEKAKDETPEQIATRLHQLRPVSREIGKQADALRAEYDRQTDALWAERDRQMAPLRAERDRQTAALRAEYKRQMAPLRAEYKRQTDALCTYPDCSWDGTSFLGDTDER